jgi:hypothetical protein
MHGSLSSCYLHPLLACSLCGNRFGSIHYYPIILTIYFLINNRFVAFDTLEASFFETLSRMDPELSTALRAIAPFTFTVRLKKFAIRLSRKIGMAMVILVRYNFSFTSIVNGAIIHMLTGQCIDIKLYAINWSIGSARSTMLYYYTFSRHPRLHRHRHHLLVTSGPIITILNHDRIWYGICSEYFDKGVIRVVFIACDTNERFCVLVASTAIASHWLWFTYYDGSFHSFHWYTILVTPQMFF